MDALDRDAGFVGEREDVMPAYLRRSLSLPSMCHSERTIDQMTKMSETPRSRWKAC